ncbi:Nucleoporin GLE1 [Golovinomyces cichoracearum]|uniref:mRNA export factor GLE1 n=1 Tax=Golovinomyces cichoracearum TaxID=62708 RepID=A0A420IJ04_9PEZI|nr:Nucleoporin GLE1 [Golovinomyces cichoracearum]
MKVSTDIDDKPKLQPVDSTNETSIIHEFSTKISFRDTEEFHTTLLSAAQIEHTRVRERALHLLELDRIKNEKENIRIKAAAAEACSRIERERASEKFKNRDGEKKVSQASKPVSIASLVPPNTSLSPLAASLPVKNAQPVLSPNKPLSNSLNQLLVNSLHPDTGLEISEGSVPRFSGFKTRSPLSTVSKSAFSVQATTPTTSTNTQQASPSTKINTQPTKAITRTASTNIEPSSLPNKFGVQNRLSNLNQSVTPKNPIIDESVSNEESSTIKPNSQAIEIVPERLISPQQYFYNQALLSINEDRYRLIHSNMKRVRKQIESQENMNDMSKELRTNCNKARREITKALGQLVVGGKNAAVIEKVIRQLRDALKNQSELIDVSAFSVKNRKAALEASLTDDDIDMNRDKLPIAFIYLLGAFCKAICAQLVSEAALKPQAASPIGILAARVFSDRRLHWRGESLIDMLIAKMCVVCPVLFGVRGDESTREGRTRIGWRKIDGVFISEQAHFDRMSGIAAGYAAISLRDFSRTKWKNPYPATNYWSTLSIIVNTPREETFSTQFVILKSLIEHSFSRFITFYGDMAIAALHAALVEFPRRGAEGSASVGSLKTLGATLQKDHGLILL